MLGNWREWLGRLGSIAENGMPDVADEFEELIDGFILLAEAVEAQEKHNLARVAADRPYPPSNIVRRVNRAYERANETHVVALRFLRGVGR